MKMYYEGLINTRKVTNASLEVENNAAILYDWIEYDSAYYKGLLSHATSLDRESVVSSSSRTSFLVKMQEYWGGGCFLFREKDEKPPTMVKVHTAEISNQDPLRERGSKPTSPQLSTPIPPHSSPPSSLTPSLPPLLSGSPNKIKKRKSRVLGYQDGDKAGPKEIHPSSPYFIHAFDYPRHMQVNDVLTDANYNVWSQEMSNFLFAINKIGFIDGSIPKPHKTDETYMAWMRCDVMIKGWLINAMEKNIGGSVKYANSALEIWNDLEERFAKKSAPRSSELNHTLTIIHQDGASILTYYTKLQSLWEEIQTILPLPHCTCGNCSCDLEKRTINFIEEDHLCEFLMGLDAEYATIQTHILSMETTPTLSEAYRLVSEYEKQRNVASERTQIETVVFQTKR